MTDNRHRYLGALLGLASGDALGTTLEFKPPGTFDPISDMVGGGPFRLAAGQWTDDTSMALCLAESLLECNGFDAGDQMRRYLRWYEDGHWSSTGHCFDIGDTTRDALMRFQRTGDPFAGSMSVHSAANGSLMRLAPVPLFFANDAEHAIAMAKDSSRTTHSLDVVTDACRYYAALILGALDGAPKDELLAPMYAPVPDLWDRCPLHALIEGVASGSFLEKQPPAIKGTGYVVHSLEAALWAFAHTDDFRSGALAVVNLGDDADTTGAIFGQLAGAYYGIDGIPSDWRERIARREEIEAVASALHDARPRARRNAESADALRR